ncbi:MAG: RNA polymerase factor sigma-54 [Myxococcota bacterium]
MELKQGLYIGQRLEQRLVMTQQLQQAIRLLQLSRTELVDSITDALNENPLLEEAAPADVPSMTMSNAITSGEGQVADFEGPAQRQEKTEIDWQSYFTDLARSPTEGTGSYRDSDEERPALSQTLTRASTLSEYVTEQLGTIALSALQREVAEDILGNLDDDGFFRPSRLDISGGTESARRQLMRQAAAADIETQDTRTGFSLYWLTDDEMAAWEELVGAKGCKVESYYANSTRATAVLHETTEPQVREVLDAIRTMDPLGVASRDLRECLLTQALVRHPEEKRLHKLIDRHLPNIEARNHQGIRKDLRLTAEELQRLLELLATMEPRPGREFVGESARYITPDVHVIKVGDDYTVVLNEDGLPRLRVSKFYQNALSEQAGSEAKDYLQEKMRSAMWMIRSIHQRQSTIQRVTESIMRFQRPFLDGGIEKLKPLVLRDVAEDVGLHESTVSRVTTNKYCHTPQGIYELKFFFNSRIQAQGGDDMASEAVKHAIARLVEKEQPTAPLSDQEIAEILQGEWDRGRMLSRLNCTEHQLEALYPTQTMTIARRTVAKYREAIHIPSSSHRRKVY